MQYRSGIDRYQAKSYTYSDSVVKLREEGRVSLRGFVERLHHTLLDEHFRIQGRTKWYETLEDMYLLITITFSLPILAQHCPFRSPASLSPIGSTKERFKILVYLIDALAAGQADYRTLKQP